MQQVKFAMQDLRTLGMLLFSTMDTSTAEFKDFLQVCTTGVGFEGCVEQAASWIRSCFWRACKDMKALDKEDDLRVLWTEASKERRDRALESFWQVMLLREGVDLQYALGCLDMTGEWSVVPDDVLQAMKTLRDASMRYCLSKLNPWTARATEEGGEEAVGLDDLAGLDIGEFGASQVLCTMEALGRVGDLGSLTQHPQGEEEDREVKDGQDEVIGAVVEQDKDGESGPEVMAATNAGETKTDDKTKVEDVYSLG